MPAAGQFEINSSTKMTGRDKGFRLNVLHELARPDPDISSLWRGHNTITPYDNQKELVIERTEFEVGTDTGTRVGEHPHHFRSIPKLTLTSAETSGGLDSRVAVTSEYFQCLWTYLRIARLFGMCPISKVGPTKLTNLPQPNIQLLNRTIAHLIHGLLCINATYLFIRSLTPFGYQSVVSALENFIYYSHCFLNGIFMSWRVRHLPELLDVFENVETICNKYSRPSNTDSFSDPHNQRQKDGLVKFCNILVLVSLVCQLCTNSLYYSSVVYRYNTTTIVTYLQSFNSELGLEIGNFYSGIIFWLSTFYCELGWAFTDIFLSILCVIITQYYTRLNQALACAGNLHYTVLEEMRSDHRQITRLVQACNSLFSPLFLITYLGNAAYLFTRLYTGFSEDLNSQHWLVTAESVAAFVFQLTRILLPTWFAANLNDKAHEALTWVHSWPSSIDSPHSNFRVLVIGRFVSQLTAYQVGISGCGYFTINKSFLVALISAFFTYEVIILQFQASVMKAN